VRSRWVIQKNALAGAIALSREDDRTVPGFGAAAKLRITGGILLQQGLQLFQLKRGQGIAQGLPAEM